MLSFCNSCDGAYDSLDVRFTKACDNACPFCIEREGISSCGATNVKEMIKSTLASGIKGVLILGGEPFLQPEKLLEYIKGIRENVDSIYITTSLPATFINKRNICDEIIRLIDGLNVSIQDINSEVNNQILAARDKHNRLDVLKSLNADFAAKIRVSVNLIKGGVDNRWKLFCTLDYLKEIGCKHVKLNELQNSPELYISYEEITDNKLKSPFSHGCQTELGDCGGMRVTLKRSCFITEPSRQATLTDLLKLIWRKYFYRYSNKFAVLYENGVISTNWKQQHE